jgi:hypothetical protein
MFALSVESVFVGSKKKDTSEKKMLISFFFTLLGSVKLSALSVEIKYKLCFQG